MLENKQKATLGEFTQKETLCENGIPLLKINIKCPEIKCKGKSTLSRYASKFYKSLVQEFYSYAKTAFYKQALSDFQIGREGFAPYSALMRYKAERFDDLLLSVYIDISLTDGVKTVYAERKTQVWELKHGTKCKISDFIGKSEYRKLKKELPDSLKEGLKRGIFTVCSEHITIYSQSGSENEKIPHKF